MQVNREELEQMALDAVSAEDYYELLDTIGETPDDDLWTVVCNQ